MHTRRLETGSEIGDMLRNTFRAQRNAFKINLVFGFILSNLETGEIGAILLPLLKWLYFRPAAGGGG